VNAHIFNELCGENLNERGEEEEYLENKKAEEKKKRVII